MPDFTVTISVTHVSKLKDMGLPKAEIEPFMFAVLEDRAINDELLAFSKARSQAIEDASKEQLDTETDAEERRLRDALA